MKTRLQMNVPVFSFNIRCFPPICIQSPTISNGDNDGDLVTVLVLLFVTLVAIGDGSGDDDAKYEYLFSNGGDVDIGYFGGGGGGGGGEDDDDISNIKDVVKINTKDNYDKDNDAGNKDAHSTLISIFILNIRWTLL